MSLSPGFPKRVELGFTKVALLEFKYINKKRGIDQAKD